MVIAIFGESCTGKSTLARALAGKRSMTVYSGRDYLRLARSEREAAEKFAALLRDPARDTVFVISEREQLRLLPECCVRVLVTADIGSIKERFAARMGGKLPPPVAAMLEKKHGTFDNEPFDVHIVSGEGTEQEACAAILSCCDQKGGRQI